MLFSRCKVRVGIAVVISFILLSTVMPLAGLETDEDTGSMTIYDRYLAFQEMRKEIVEQKGPMAVPDDGGFGYESGPYPIPNDDASLPRVNSLTLGELMDNPPYLIGYGLEAYGASDYYVVGTGHEQYLGDINNDGLISWLAYYFDMGLSVNGVDDDGDGCVDEVTNMTPDGQQCDTVPDAVVFFSTGVAMDISGDLIVYGTTYEDMNFVGFFRIGASPRWIPQGIRLDGPAYYPRFSGEFVSYSAAESWHNVNVNKAIGDKDLHDQFIGLIDARKFPSRPPKHHYCRTGFPIYSGYGYEREDGFVVVTFELREYYDEAPGYDNDYNDDGDTMDRVIGYFIVNSRSGKCKKFVNTGVAGQYPQNAGNIIASGIVYEGADQRDWNNDGDMIDYVSVWHDVTSTEKMAGDPYFGHTFRAPVPRGPAGSVDSYGFGFTGLYLNRKANVYTFPLEFGGSYYLYIGYPRYYEAYYWHYLDEDWNQWTELPGYVIAYGMPFDSPGGICIGISGREYYLEDDINNDGDTMDVGVAFYCPDPDVPGTGGWEIEPASTHPPWITVAGMFYYYSSGGKYLITWVFFDLEYDRYVSRNWHFNRVDPDFEILDAQWAGEPLVKMKGSISGYIDVENIWETDILCHARLDNDLGWGMQYNGCVENTERDGILRPGETARVHFTLFAPDKGKTGVFTLTIDLTLQRVTRSVQLVVELYK